MTGNAIFAVGEPIPTTGNAIFAVGEPIPTTGNAIFAVGEPIQTTGNAIFAVGERFRRPETQFSLSGKVFFISVPNVFLPKLNFRLS